MTPDANGKVAFDGLELTFTGTPAVNDSFTLKPVSDAIVNMDVLITDEAKIAMASAEDAAIATTATVRPCSICKATVKRWAVRNPLTTLMPR